MTEQIAVLIGSASKTSFNKLVVSHLQKMAPAGLRLNVVEIADLPLYDRDLDENSPASYTRLREEIARADGVLFVTPEHNGAISAMLKNAIDIASRPMGQSKWLGKPAGIVTVGAGAAGGVRATDQLRTIASGAFVNMPVAPFAANVGGLFNGVFDENGEIAADGVKTMLQQFIDSYAAFVERF
ncbi:NADPH-dependent FMN reductase [Pasteurellaceae bacterium LIM206]|nr:NADPH-dependent FMN reductase [Pasteurellaceae bacterium LIM206]